MYLSIYHHLKLVGILKFINKSGTRGTNSGENLIVIGTTKVSFNCLPIEVVAQSVNRCISKNYVEFCPTLISNTGILGFLKKIGHSTKLISLLG